MKKWIGVDLDGTLVKYTTWKGDNHIGEPIPKIVNLINNIIKKGIQVKIFTARASKESSIKIIQKWLVNEANLPKLDVTNIKDHGMIMLYDDRCRQVIKNTGEIVGNE